MKKLVRSYWIVCFVAIVVWGVTTGCDSTGAQGQDNIMSRFQGDWGCSFTSPVSFFGPLAGIAEVQLDSDGNLSGTETIATSDPFIEANATLSGQLFPESDGTIGGDITVTVDIPGAIPVSGSLKCVGMDRIEQTFREMRCLDLVDEPEGTDSVSILECKRQ